MGVSDPQATLYYLARMLTANPQFSRTTVNLFWSKLMGVGFVEPWDEFDLARQDPKNLPKDMSVGKSPEGKALKFVHRGSYDNMDNTYEAITNHLDDKKLEAKDTFIEEYITDPLKTAEDKLVINVYVPLR